MSSRQIYCIATGAALLLVQCFNSAHARLVYTSSLTSEVDVVIDVRSESACLEKSLPLTVCLPVKDLLAEHNRLINFSGLFWLLGTLGLRGSEYIAIVGDKSQERDFVAGLLFIAGQAKIDVVSQSLETLLNSSTNTAQGRSRASTRQTIFTGPSRTNLLVLKSELLSGLKAENEQILLDGRTEGEYWGRTIRASRGGHLPGAMHAPHLTQLPTQSDKLPIAYAHDQKAGLAYFARLTSQQLDTRLYLGGWAEWASDASLSVDAESFLDMQRVREVGPADRSSNLQGSNRTATANVIPSSGLIAFGLVVLLLVLVPSAYFLGRTRGSTA